MNRQPLMYAKSGRFQRQRTAASSGDKKRPKMAGDDEQSDLFRPNRPVLIESHTPLGV